VKVVPAGETAQTASQQLRIFFILSVDIYSGENRG
jgi:hypothetical protein